MAALCTAATAQNWLLNGNAGTNGGVNYLGTSDLHPLVFRTNALERMRIDSTNGFVGIGTNAPLYKLSINGTASLADRTIGINGTPVVYLPEQGSSLAWSVAFGTGLRNLIGNNFSNQGSGNTAVGIHSMDAVTTGIDNTAVGRYSLNNNISGGANVAIGATTLPSVTTGYRNIAIGFVTMQATNTGWDNIGIGAFAETIGPNAANLTNAVAIGVNTKVGKDNAICLGDTVKPTMVGIGTAYPDYKLDVKAPANPLRLRGLQAGDPTDYIVTANSNGVIRQIPASSIGGSVNGEQGVTDNGSNTVFLGDECAKGGGKFKKDREINMDNLNLYFNSSEIGKLYMGVAGDCRKLATRLEISAKGLPYINDYDITRPSPSGLRFTDLTAKDAPVKPKYKGVLSLDEDGDVLWVENCGCEELKAMAAQSQDVENLKATVAELKAELAELKAILNTLKGNTSDENSWTADGQANTLLQNVPNPSDKSTRIEYSLNKDCRDAYIALYDMNGKSIDRIAVKAVPGKSSVQVNIEKLATGSYPYALFVNGIKQDAKVMQVVR